MDMFELPFIVPRLLDFIVSYWLFSALGASLRFVDECLLKSLIDPVTVARGSAAVLPRSPIFASLATSMPCYARRKFCHSIQQVFVCDTRH